MQFNYQEALDVIREKHISWVEYFFRNYGVDIFDTIKVYQEQLTNHVNNNNFADMPKLEDYITNIARGIEGTSESLENVPTEENTKWTTRLSVRVQHINVDENVTDPVKFIKDVVDQFKQSPVNTTKDDVSLKPSDGDDSKKVYIAVEHLNSNCEDNTETYCFDKDVIVLTFNKYGEWQGKAYHITEDDLLVHKGHISKVTRVYK